MESRLLPPEFLKALGGISVEIAGLERLMTFAIQWCSSIATWDEAIAIVGGDSLDHLIKKLDKIIKCNLRDEEQLQLEFSKVIANISDVNDRRNKYIHSYWTIDEYPPLDNVRRRKFTRNPKSHAELDTSELVPVKDLDTLLTEIAEANHLLASLLIDNGGAIKAAIRRRVDEVESESRFM